MIARSMFRKIRARIPPSMFPSMVMPTASSIEQPPQTPVQKKRLHDATIEQPHRYDEAVDGDACLQKIYGVIGCNILFAVPYNGGH